MEKNWKSILVVGLGKSGQAATEALLERKFHVACFDSSFNQELQKAKERLENKGAKVFLGEESLPEFSSFDLIVLSPGISKKSELFGKIRQSGVPFFGEIELAYQLGLKDKVFIVGVTGTNGKTTVTELIGRVLKKAGQGAVVGGNIGSPLSGLIGEVKKGSILVCELSSFQLDTLVEFRSQLAVILNITRDHLDWHIDFDDYVRAKAKILANQTSSDAAVINYDDSVVKKLACKARGQTIFYSRMDPEAKVRLEGDWIVTTLNTRAPFERVLKFSDLRTVGWHNLENALAVIAACKFLGVEAETIAQTLKEFPGLPHRLEEVGSFKGIRFYDDSKATNPDAVVRAVDAFSRPLVLLLGGLNKGNSFEELAEKIVSYPNKIKVVVFGEAKEEIASSLSEKGLKFETERNLKEAFKKAIEITEPGEVVLLSPGCASFDEFGNYAERGDFFKKMVKEWAVEGKLF